jgi:Histidine kinase-, DNA gyrase B-, and HSP90-like ATPase
MINALREELSKLELEQAKSNIERIISSYRHIWDIYTELLQNSTDAVIDEFGDENLSKGIIKLEINTQDRELVITDNGVGIQESDLSKILVTGKSLKRERDSGKFGFMGYGFTFVAFQTQYLKIESTHQGIRSSRTYKDLYKFVFDEGDIPNSEEEKLGSVSQETSESNGTKIELVFPGNFPDETVEQALLATFRVASKDETILAVLRTRTSVGLLDPIFKSGQSFKFYLVIDSRNVNVEPHYLTIREIAKKVLLNETSFYSLSQYEILVSATETLPRITQEQARKTVLLDLVLDDLQIGERNPLNVRVLISATSKSLINQYNEGLQFDHENSDYAVEHGVWLAINGMPTSICLDPFDHSTYLPYTVIVDVKDKSLRKELDAGRKGISDYRRKQIAEKTLEILRQNKFITYRRYIIGGSGAGSRISNPLYEPKRMLLDKLRDEKTYIESGLNHNASSNLKCNTLAQSRCRH